MSVACHGKSVHDLDRNVGTRVLSAMELIDLRRKTMTGSKSFSAPPYHFFQYKGLECGVLQCLTLNTSLVGFVKKPPHTVLKWPETCLAKPFDVGIDFELPWRGNMLVGFHTLHLIHDTSFPGMRIPATVDYVVTKLREFIDMCSSSGGGAVEPAAQTRKNVRAKV